ncbi:MAG: hypothetical protein ONB45_23745 [candidate division KSB1 bacterium]|nr:hypothetical protein [candidate division KSB1 bacterium]
MLECTGQKAHGSINGKSAATEEASNLNGSKYQAHRWQHAIGNSEMGHLACAIQRTRPNCWLELSRIIAETPRENTVFLRPIPLTALLVRNSQAEEVFFGLMCL